MSAAIEPGDRVEWQGTSQMMSGFVHETSGGQATVYAYDGDTRPENRSVHTVDLDRLQLKSKGSV